MTDKKPTSSYYERNKAKCIQNAAKNRKKYRQDWIDFKASLSCSICGESHPATLDFHHIDRKNKKSINALLKQHAYKAAKLEATEKCTVLCANCHRKLHYEELKNQD